MAWVLAGLSPESHGTPQQANGKGVSDQKSNKTAA
jgi:hypothetical protein